MPYQEFGKTGLERYSDLAGFNGAEAQSSEIDMLRSSPLYKTLYDSGEEAVLSNASATGGLRGGNTNRSLYELGENTLSSVIAQQLGNYGSAIGVGSGATGAVSAFGANSVAQQAALRNQGAQARAQSALVRGGIQGQNWQNLGTFADDALSSFAGGGGSSWGSFF